MVDHMFNNVGFSEVRVPHSLVLCVVACGSLFVLLSSWDKNMIQYIINVNRNGLMINGGSYY